MRAIILKTTCVNENDLLLHLASEQGIFKAYRFYGMRHSSINCAHHVDFELESSPTFLPRMRSVMQLLLPFEKGEFALKYCADSSELYEFEHIATQTKQSSSHWGFCLKKGSNISARLAFVKFVSSLCARVHECDYGFYYKELLRLAEALCVQEIGRALIDAHARILHHEGHLAGSNECANCAKKLTSYCSVGENFALFCPECLRSNRFSSTKMQEFLQTCSSAIFENDEICELEKVVFI